MKIVLEKKYLVVPINSNAVTKKLCFYNEKNGEQKLIMDFDCKMDFADPTYWGYIDVSKYQGMELEYCSIPSMDFVLTQSDEKKIDNVYHEEFRPMVHYTPQIGWINDPNGLIKYHGTYHMFYQYNPLGIEWGNMHWGHAISRDLFHWQEQDAVLFPDEMGTMFSGSAIEDIRNVSGLQTNENPPILLFYTAAGDCSLLSKGQKYTQCLAVSTDGGKTFEKYHKNPIVEWIAADNRDPKVVWVEELSRYVMGLYLEGHRYCLLTSENLLDWTILQELEINNEGECPDITCYELDGKKYWVIIGASDYYVVGVFEDGKFVVLTKERKLTYSPSRFSYAAQSYSGIDDGRNIRMIWDKINMPSKRTPHQMSVPMELRLVKCRNDLLLTSFPADEIKQMYVGTDHRENFSLEESISYPLMRAAYDIQLQAEYGVPIQIEWFGHTIRLNTEDNCVEFQKHKFPISVDQKSIDLRIVIDRCSIEIFSDAGKYSATYLALCDYNVPYLTISAKDTVRIDSLSVSKLKSIYVGEENRK